MILKGRNALVTGELHSLNDVLKQCSSCRGLLFSLFDLTQVVPVSLLAYARAP